MSNQNQHVIDELNSFRASEETFYAFQIDAPWGSGKTYFIKQYIKDHCPKDAEDSPKNLVITLFGVKSAQEIEQQIASQLFTGGERLAGSVFSTLATGVSGFFKVDKAVTGVLDDSRAKILSDRLKEVRKGIVVFDDVERCSMKLIDALGYINKFVEKENFKVIIISNEQALNRVGASKEEIENAVLLTGFKEKLVGRSLQLKADPDKAYDTFVKSLKCEKAKSLAVKEKSSALAVFRASKHENLRSLRIALEAFDRLVAGFDPTIAVKDAGLRDILGGCIYVAVEIGAAMRSDLVSYPTAGRLSRLMRGMAGKANKEPSEEENTLDKIIKRYSDVLNLQSPTISFEILVDFIANGVLRKPELEQSLRTSPLMAEPSKTPLWRRLIDVWNYNSDRLRDDTQELISKFAGFDILDPGELLHLAGIMLWRESLGDLSISSGVDPEAFLEKYLADLKSSGKYLDVKLDVFAMDRLSAYNYVVLGADDFKDKLLRIHSLIKSAMDEAASLKHPEVYKVICDSLIAKDRDIDNLLDKDLSPYLQMPIFKTANASDFSDIIMRNNEFDVGTLKWLNSRYKHLVSPTVRSEEQSWIDALYAELSSRIATSIPPLNKWWRTILDQNLQQFVSPPQSATSTTTPASIAGAVHAKQE
ncbi:P-loop NTPase fold protein [Microvirga lotononidis]|uniref:KAP family P-loop domain protein n=1 Tax=Microvirga lotononidis TaxID=864069 RepID=I4YSG7_9HYPH|nr:P-loop NTPase fold protein [Microvirga lotononidis]EIM26909.1 KAP family P-loop domain protein [Microvirga lotononidis]WQO31460.1 P-loop NTPase fold protein [Microvirga lotononidis]